MKPVHRRIALAIAAAALTFGAMLWIMGSAVVIDQPGAIASAAITDSSGATQPLHRLPGSIFYALPRLEGVIEVRCRDGSREQWGYVTRHMHTWLRVEPGPACGRPAQLR